MSTDLQKEIDALKAKLEEKQAALGYLIQLGSNTQHPNLTLVGKQGVKGRESYTDYTTQVVVGSLPLSWLGEEASIISGEARIREDSLIATSEVEILTVFFSERRPGYRELQLIRVLPEKKEEGSSPSLFDILSDI